MAATDINNTDAHVDEEIFDGLNPQDPKSFFLFAGAGSGKTKTLVTVLRRIREKHGRHFLLRHQRIAVITYTNAAADEIMHRLEQNVLFQVSTIHSFCWDLIQGLTADIREWLKINLRGELSDLSAAQAKSRDLGNKSSLERAVRMTSKTKRLESLDGISKFTYNPNGDNISRDSLNHAEVIALTAYFMREKSLMQEIIVDRFPIILIDESQDTKKELIDAFFHLQATLPKRVSLGLLGDTMQRIYSDGKENLGNALPKDWLTPVKQMNHRSQKRIIDLVNTIRGTVDKQLQLPRAENQGGLVRLFIADSSADKDKAEAYVSERMAELTGDPKWRENRLEVKTLILEHHMAARRMGFLDFFQPLYENDRLKTGLLEGSLSSIGIFTRMIIPLYHAHLIGDKFAIGRLVKQHSPLISKDNLALATEQLAQLALADKAVEALIKLWKDGAEPSGLDILKSLSTSRLFTVPDVLRPLLMEVSERELVDEEIEKGAEAEQVRALASALSVPFSQIVNYDRYLSEKSQFGTHQGVKGLEYSHVMVIIDDEESRGFMFKYDTLFGISGLSDTDRKNIKEKKETVMDRTRRLFYVACSRAKESLAIIAYTHEPSALEHNALEFGWFSKLEIERMT
ncbi:UvrD-helicase domain-containing protein [Pedobacter sp. BMA]|uniref:UvrD-helicase domain-containing protein n=1 Tax=Pedobacter sp. BMA TaxID=1663685 RepID=UPI0006492B21|nr:UvrD-helicase domain-containing protein [Pedobacter sp. BMA]KLT63924.1 hypothetical protein AB669_19535 [Pedobacter sp. BMA]